MRSADKKFMSILDVLTATFLEDSTPKKLKFYAAESLVDCMSRMKRFYEEITDMENEELNHWSEVRDTDCPFCLRFCGNPLCVYATSEDEEE